jgi:hypothetical protein
MFRLNQAENLIRFQAGWKAEALVGGRAEADIGRMARRALSGLLLHKDCHAALSSTHVDKVPSIR